LLSRLERLSERSRAALWARSLFAIYDIEDMVAIDLPWWSLDAIREADAFLRSRPTARVLEYGSGASTIWLARRAMSVVSVEHDPSWYPVVLERLAGYPNARLKLIGPDPHPVEGYLSEKKGWRGRSFHDYASAIEQEEGLFDLIVIDGRARAACLRHARDRLAGGGLILFDNSGRERYQAAIEASGMIARRLRGVTACLPYPDETALLQHPPEPSRLKA
jgi:hypothetical protein